MTKTKTKRTIWTILIIVAVFAIAAIFYVYKQGFFDKPEEMKEVVVEEPIVASDVQPTDTENSSREYISEYYKEKDRFNAIGVSWEETGTKSGDVTFYIRVKDGESEGQWFEVYKNLVKTENNVTYYSAESPILARGDEYQYKITFKDDANKVQNIKFSVINTMGTTYERLFKKISSNFDQKVEAAWDPANIISRSTWGGATVNVSETLWPPEYAQKSTKFVVHHTVGTNYSCATYTQDEAEADVLAIWQYHTYGNDWGDIGYNYLVDPCGRVYEGRLGGNNVIAGHAAPYNYWDKIDNDGIIDEATIGVSMMGDYSSVVPESSMFEGIDRIIGYKSYINNINPLGTSLIKEINTYNIAGHRDYDSTACPGAELYDRLAAIRSGSNAHLNLFLDAYGPYIDESSSIYVNAFRVNMDDLNGGVTLVNNPAVGEPLYIRSALKNVGNQPVDLSNIRVIGRYDNGVEFTIGTQTSLSIAAGQVAILSLDRESFNISSTRTMSFRLDYEIEGQVKNPQYFDGFNYPTYTPHIPNVKLNSNPVAIPESPAINTQSQVSFSIKNYDSRPAYLKKTYLIVDNDFNNTSSQLTDVKINPGSVYNSIHQITFDQMGVYSLTPVTVYGNGSIAYVRTLAGGVVSKSISVLSEPIDYSKISQNTLRITIGDYSTPDPDDYLYQFSSPAIGEEITMVAAIRNDNNSDVALSNVRVVGVYDNGVKFVVGSTPSLIVPANSVALVPEVSYRITSFRTVHYVLDYETEGVRKFPTIGAGYSPMRITPHFPTVKAVSIPGFIPGSTALGNPITGVFQIKNYDSRPAYLKSIRLRYCTSGLCWSFPNVVHELVPGETYSYSQVTTPAIGGEYRAEIWLVYGNGSLFVPSGITGVNNYGYFNIYTEVAVMDGYSIPATSGKTAKEQHLWLIANQVAISSPPVATDHYVMSSTPVAYQNGMAGNAGSFGGYGYPPIVDERYYITMRWNYTDWYQAPDGTCSTVDGHPDTCTRNTDYTDKAWHWKKRVVVTNPANGKKVVCSVLESGPAIWTGRVSGLSPEALGAIGAATNSTLNYAWAANQSIPLGLVN